MNITIIGASSGVGLESVKRALARNHKVTALSRSEIRIAKNENLKQIIGNAIYKIYLKISISNADAVIVTLGTGKSVNSTTLYSDFAKLLVEVYQEINSKIPVIIVTGFGAGESSNFQNNFLSKLFFKFILNDVYADKTKMEEIISRSNINWIIVRPGMLKDQPLTGKYRVESSLFKGIKIGSIGRADVADFLIKQAENPLEIHKYPALSNK